MTETSSIIWLNLRPAENGPNIQNSKLRKDNKSGVKGVHWDAHHKKWKAVVTANKKTKQVGRFSTVERAAAAIAVVRLTMHGDFARFA